MKHRTILTARHHQLVGQYRENRPQRVDHDPFPAQQSRHAAYRSHAAQQGNNYGRAGHHHQGTEQQSQPERQLQHPPGGNRHDTPGHQGAPGDQPAHRFFQPTNFIEAQGHRAFEQDNGYRQRDTGKQQVAEQLLGLQYVEKRAKGKAGKQQRQNGGELDSPG